MVRAAVCAGFVVAALLGDFAQAAAPEVPAEAFAALPQVSDVELSPNGKLLAWRDESGPVAKVVIYDIDAKSYRRSLTIDPSMTLLSLLWADDQTLLINLSTMQQTPAEEGRRSYRMWRTMSVDINSGNSCMLLRSTAGAGWVNGDDLIASHTTEANTVIMDTLVPSPNTGGWIMDLFRVDTRTGVGTILSEGDRYTQDWAVNAQGTPLARSEWRPRQKQYLLQAKSGMTWRPVFERDDDQFTLHGLSSDGKSVFVEGPSKDGWVRLWTVALDGSGAKQVSPDVSADVVDVIYDHFSGVPTGVKLAGIHPQVHWFDPAAEARDESVARAFPGREVSVYDHSQDGSRVLAAVQDRSHPPIYYLVDFKTHGATIVGEAYPALDKVALGSVSTITYAARDGTAIPAYLTLPPGMAPKNLPMVVLPHGGPEEHDTSAFDWFAQFLAVRGYAVLQPEFRGSTGFGEAFHRAGMRQWGGLMQDDITDGVKALIRQGIADPHHICIVGLGFGGYAALAGAAFTPQLYACAVSINGISDLSAFVGFQTGQFPSTTLYWRREIGGQFDHDLADRSPINSAAEMKAPVLLLHAADDTYVPYLQSEQMARALADLGQPVALVKLAGDDHELSNAANRLQVLQDTDEFLRQYLK